MTTSTGTGSNGSLSTSGAGKSTRPTHRTRTPPSSVRYNVIRKFPNVFLSLRIQTTVEVAVFPQCCWSGCNWVSGSGGSESGSKPEDQIATHPPPPQKKIKDIFLRAGCSLMRAGGLEGWNFQEVPYLMRNYRQFFIFKKICICICHFSAGRGSWWRLRQIQIYD